MAEHQSKELAVTGSTPVPHQGEKPSHDAARGRRASRAIRHRGDQRPPAPTSSRSPSSCGCRRESASSRHAVVRWQHDRVPCSARIPLPPTFGQAATDVWRLARTCPGLTSQTEIAAKPKARRLLKRHSAPASVIARWSRPRGLFQEQQAFAESSRHTPCAVRRVQGWQFNCHPNMPMCPCAVCLLRHTECAYYVVCRPATACQEARPRTAAERKE
jgi:hypothetical protein